MLLQSDPWALVIHENRSKLLGYLIKVLRCPAIAEDVLHDTYIRLRNMSTEQQDSVINLRSFCYQVARNIAIDVLRKQQKQKSMEQEDLLDAMLDESQPDPEQQLQEQQAKISINRLVATMPPRHQSIWRHYKTGDMKQNELATMFEISPTMVNFIVKDIVRICQKALNSG